MNRIEVPVPSVCLRHFSWQMQWRPYHEGSKVHVGRRIWSQYSVEHLAGLFQNEWTIIRKIQIVRGPISPICSFSETSLLSEEIWKHGAQRNPSSVLLERSPGDAGPALARSRTKQWSWKKRVGLTEKNLEGNQHHSILYFNLGTIPSSHDRLTGIRRWFWLMAQSTSGSGSYPRSFWSSLVGRSNKMIGILHCRFDILYNGTLSSRWKSWFYTLWHLDSTREWLNIGPISLEFETSFPPFWK